MRVENGLRYDYELRCRFAGNARAQTVSGVPAAPRRASRACRARSPFNGRRRASLHRRQRGGEGERPLLGWPRVERASYYNVQLFRGVARSSARGQRRRTIAEAALDVPRPQREADAGPLSLDGVAGFGRRSNLASASASCAALQGSARVTRLVLRAARIRPSRYGAAAWSAPAVAQHAAGAAAEHRFHVGARASAPATARAPGELARVGAVVRRVGRSRRSRCRSRRAATSRSTRAARPSSADRVEPRPGMRLVQPVRHEDDADDAAGGGDRLHVALSTLYSTSFIDRHAECDATIGMRLSTRS